MQDRPTVQELLAAVRAFLEEEAMPVLDRRRGFLARVAANVLAIVGREIADEEADLRAEWARLAPLIGREAEAPVGLAALRGAVRDGTVALSEHIRRGEADAEPLARAVRDHVRETVRAKLRVANPRYLGEE